MLILNTAMWIEENIGEIGLWWPLFLSIQSLCYVSVAFCYIYAAMASNKIDSLIWTALSIQTQYIGCS